MDETVDSPRSQQRWIHYIDAVGGSDQDHIMQFLKPVQFCQNLGDHTLGYEGISAASTRRYDRIDLIKEYDRWRCLPCLAKQVSYGSL